jgi:hypothetical protein
MEELHNTIKQQEEPELKPESQPEIKPEGKKKRGNKLRWVLDGTFLTRKKMIDQLPFLLIITLMGMAYIFNSNYADKTIIQISRTKSELEELRFNYINTKSKLMQGTRQSELVHRLEARGVKESMIPPRKIIIESNGKSN